MNLRKTCALLGASALIAMGGLATACSPRNEQPAETNAPSSKPSAETTPTEKNVRTNVTRSPMSVAPNGGGNGAVPCGFGPAGGGPCSNNNNR